MPTAFNVYLSGNIQDIDIRETVIRSLRKGADELGQIELFNISARTPVDTGALLSDEFYLANPNDVTLVRLGVNTENQLDEWGRVYAPYQEGGDLGLSTYTNGPHEMFAKVQTDDLDAIEEWLRKWGQAGLDECAAGTGVPK